MSLQHWLLACLMTVGFIAALAANLIQWEMVEQLNRRLPPEKRRTPVWWSLTRWESLTQTYRAEFGKDRLWRLRRAVFAIMLGVIALVFVLVIVTKASGGSI